MEPIVIIGGGISGITAAVELAETGKDVVLVEQKPYLGGNVVQMNNYFPKLCPPVCGLEINFRRIRQNQRIKCLTSTTVTSIEGKKGDFSLTLKTSPNYINDTCTACGKCTEVCPVEMPNGFNYGHTAKKAINLPHPMAFPQKYHIDIDGCTKETCNKCLEVCSYNAIDFSAKEVQTSLIASNIIIATGWKNYSASKIENLGYGAFRNVVSNVEFERFLAPDGIGKGKVHRPSDQKEPESIAFVQCVGSRDENHLPYCSAVCCSASLKHALTLLEKSPQTKIKIFYIDLRVSGRNEDILKKVEENENIELIKGKVAMITENPENKNLFVEAEDILKGKKQKYQADMVILATGIVPNAVISGLPRNNAGFLDDIQKQGIYPVSCSKRPMDVSASVKDATAAALKAIQQ